MPIQRVQGKQKIIVILGQTATGKSDLAVKIAKKIGGEVISADSRQVYKGLDIGTGKITKKEMHGVPHYLLDVASPKRRFSVAEYQKLAISTMVDMCKRDKIPIICGGTGFYIDSVVNGMVLPEVPPNFKLRKKLSSLSAIANFAYLKKLDPERAKNIDPKNKVRLIRAIEIAKALGRVPRLTEATPPYEVLKIGLKLHPEILKAKIKYRLLARLEKGMLKEAKKLHKNGLSLKRMKELGLEYKYLAMFLEKEIDRKGMIKGLANAIWQYAKRQMTWFKRDQGIKWFDPTQKSDLKKVNGLVKKFLS